MQAWGGRFEAGPADVASAFGSSLDVDRELALDDVAGSIAHVHGLARAGLLTAAEAAVLTDGLGAIRADIESGSIAWDPAHEDIHMAIEFALAERLGPVAGKLHTARSRNDQVATDLRLWTRRMIGALDEGLVQLERALVALALAHRDLVIPGHTHVQPAQPVLLAHHLLAYVEMLERDRGRLADALARANVSPLGAGAIAGSGHPLDREATAAELGFEGATRNSIDATGDRDFVAETLAGVALAMVHLSRLAEELVWWSSPRFGFVRLSDAYSTGSSMLPNKRNPDPAELVRGKAGVVIGQLTGVLATLKGVPLGYQRDLQEVKAPFFEGCRTLRSSLEVLSGLIATIEVDDAGWGAAATDGYATAVSIADLLVDRGVAFREAHHVAGRMVRSAEAAGITLADLDDAAVHGALAPSGDPVAAALASSASIADDVRAAAAVGAALARADVTGGTAPSRVAAELEAAARRLGLSL